MMAMTKKQKKIFTFVGIVIIAFAIFIIFIYIPADRRLEELRKEYVMLQAEINDFNKSVGGEGKSLEDVVLSLKNKLDSLDKKFPEKEEIILRELLGLAESLGIEITSTRPDKKRTVKEIGSAAVNIKDCVVQEMPIAISLKTSYKTLGEFLRTLKENFSAFVRIDSVHITRMGPDKAGALLEVSLNLDSYLICPQGG